VLEHLILKSHGLTPVNKIGDGVIFGDNPQPSPLPDHFQVINPFWFQVLYVPEPGFTISHA
jgi:hypothetical protein